MGEPARIGKEHTILRESMSIQITLDRIELLPTPTTMDHLPQRGFESMEETSGSSQKRRTKLANLREAVNPQAVELFNFRNIDSTNSGSENTKRLRKIGRTNLETCFPQ